MAGDEWHQKYAPIMHFSRGERFFLMSVDDDRGYERGRLLLSRSCRIAYCDICHSTCGASGSEDSEPDDWFFNILCGWNFSTSL